MKNDNRQTVLIVDDIPENIDILIEPLKDLYTIRAARNGVDALAIAGSDAPPDLILLDVMMPEMDGYEVCRTLKANVRTRRIPVVFVTALNEIEDEKTGFEVGGVDYITKPIKPEIVRARVRTHLALYDINRTLEEKVQERTLELNETRLEIIHRLGIAAEYKDNETGQHIMRMSQYCQQIGQEYGLKKEELQLLKNAAPMHDVGKIGVPDRILQKPGKLDAEEWEIMKTHTTIGGVIIGDHPSTLLKTARIIALSHHEKWDGSGYPLGLSGNDIPLFGRIVALADVFDALTSERPYKRAWKIEDAIAEIKKGSGTHFDPDLVTAFNKALPRIIEIKQEYKG